MINYAVNTARRMPVWLGTMALLGVIIGVFVGHADDALSAVYDEAFPILSVQAEVRIADSERIVVALKGEKYRSCQFLRIDAFTRHDDGVLADAYMRRTDQIQDGSTKPLGRFDMGTWAIWPRDGAMGVVIYSQHACYGRLVQTRLTELRYNDEKQIWKSIP